MKKTTVLFLGVMVMLALPGCIAIIPEPTAVDISPNNKTNNLEYILLDEEGIIASDLCSERGFDDKVIILESRYCGACRIAVPILKEIEEEEQAEFLFLDLSEKCNLEKMKEFRIMPKYTPTILIGCEVLIGAYSKEKYKALIEDFLKQENSTRLR